MRIFGTLAALLLASPSRGAEVTRVLSSGEPDSPFGISLDVRYQFQQRIAKISREFGDNGVFPTGAVQLASELSYAETSHRIVPRLAIGLSRDLEIHAELPYVLADDAKWTDDATRAGAASLSSVLGNQLDASGNPVDVNGNPCTGACTRPLFPLASGNQLHAGGLDDLKVGVAWAIFNDRRDPHGATWVVGLDVTFPTAARYDPADKRLTRAAFDAGPPATTSSRAALGHKIWVWDLSTALSRRVGAVEPYFRAHLAIPQRSSSTYSNCEHATELVGLGEMWQGAGGVDAASECSGATWHDKAVAQPPLVVGAVAGIEVVPQEDRATGQRLAIDFRLGTELNGESRWYNELTPATGKLLHTDAYAVLSGQVGLTWRSSRYFALSLKGTGQHELAHYLTGESPRGATANGTGQNPNYDWRWDPSGRRFRVGQTLVFGGSAALTFGY